MNFNEYQEKARSTAIYPNIGSNITYPALGLAGETGELLSKIVKEKHILNNEHRLDLLKEAGDVLWYVANLASEIQVSLEDVVKNLKATVEFQQSCEGASIYAVCLASVICEKTKKVLRDKNGIVDDAYVSIVSENLAIILSLIDQIAQKLNSSISEVMEQNIEKLFSRKQRNVLKGDGDNR